MSQSEQLDLTRRKNGNLILRLLGPGLVTGAADDDPSGIATYSQAGAQFGYGLLWTVFLTTPFMIAIPLVSAHIAAHEAVGCESHAIARSTSFSAAGPMKRGKRGSSDEPRRDEPRTDS